MCDEKKPKLKVQVKEQLRELEAAVERFIADDESSAYRTAAVALRALLTDRNGLHSWVCQEHRGGYSNIMEYLHSGNIHLKSMLVPHDVSKLQPPDVFLTNHALFGDAAADNPIVPLKDWLGQIVGPKLDVRDMIRNIGGKDMAHIISIDSSRDQGDRYRDMFVITKVDSGREINPWPQFIIGAGIRLLYSRYYNGHKYVRIYPKALESTRSSVSADLMIRRRVEPKRSVRVGGSPARPFDPFVGGVSVTFGNSEGLDVSDAWKK